MAIIVNSVVFGDYVYNHLTHENPDNKRNNFAKHVHNSFEILLFLSGDATYIIEDKKYKLNPYDLVLVPPSHYHYIHIDSNMDYERFNLLLPYSEICEFVAELNVVNCNDNNIILDLFRKMDRYCEMGEDVIKDLLPGLIKEIFYNLRDLSKHEIAKHQNMSPIILSALNYIKNNLFTIKDIDEISRALFIAPTYFFRIFKEQMKISPKKYITVKRLMTAEKMIKEGKKPTEVYTLCGFSTYTAFYKRYIDYFGISPSKTI